MKKKQIIWAVFALVVVGGGAFWGGMAYAKSQTPARVAFGTGTATFTRGTGTTGAGFAGRGGAAGGSATGQIISQDSTGVTIKLANGNTQIVLVSPTTPILKQVSGSTSDLVSGTNVVVTGTANSDGSLTAQSVQIRPAGAQTPASVTQNPQTQ